MKHYRATELNGWLRKTGYAGLSSEGDWYFVQYRWPFGRWKSRFEQAPTAREEELRTKEAATSLAKARQVRAISRMATGVALGWVALETGLWWYSLQGAPWTTLGAMGLGWVWAMEDWWHRESERLEALGEPPAPLAEEEADPDEPVQQALDEVLRSTPGQGYNFYSELPSTATPPVLSFGALPRGFGWRVNSTGSPQGRDDPVPDPRPAPPTGSSQGRNDPSQSLTMGRVYVDPVTGRLVFNNTRFESVSSDMIDEMIRGNNAHIFVQCAFLGTADPRLDASRSSGMINFTTTTPVETPALPEPLTAEQVVRLSTAVQSLAQEDFNAVRALAQEHLGFTPSFSHEDIMALRPAVLNRPRQAVKDPDPPPPPPPSSPFVSSAERRRRRVQRILKERGGPAPAED